MAPSKRDAIAVDPGQAWMVRAWKWGAGSLSAAAALVSILSSVRSITANQQVRWIGLAPAADTAWSLGDTIQLATTITDGHGGVLPGVSVGWTSTDTSVASVDSAGTVLVRAPGATTVIAAAGGRIAQSRIVVKPRPAAIRIFGDSLLRLPEGGTARLVARVVDGRRHPVSGQSLVWRTADASVARVDSAGRLTAVASGRVTLVATDGDLAAELPLEVYPAPATITLLEGDGQRAPAGHRLPRSIAAQVVSRGGRPMAAVAVRFALAEGTGRVEREIDTTDADGIVRAAWILGGRPGRQRLTIGVADDGSITTLVVAEADPLPEDTRITLIGETPSGGAGTALGEPVALRVTDSTGAPLADLPVTWETEDGGSVAAEVARTDSLGEARARWTLGPRSGLQRAFMRVGSARAVPRFAVKATALPGAAATIAASRGAPLWGVAGQPVGSLAFRVSDRAGNPVAGVPVTVRTSSGAANLAAPTTDSLGLVPVTWTLGSAAGPQRISASARGIERSAELSVQVRAGPTAKAVLEGLPPTAPAGQPLPVAVLMTDAYGNPVTGATVTFVARAGKVTPSRARSDSLGRVQARWVLATKAGDQVLEASVKENGKRVTGTVRAVAARRKR